MLSKQIFNAAPLPFLINFNERIKLMQTIAFLLLSIVAMAQNELRVK